MSERCSSAYKMVAENGTIKTINDHFEVERKEVDNNQTAIVFTGERDENNCIMRLTLVDYGQEDLTGHWDECNAVTGDFVCGGLAKFTRNSSTVLGGHWSMRGEIDGQPKVDIGPWTIEGASI